MFARGARHHRGRWIASGVVLFLVLLLVGARLALTPFVAGELRKQLNARPDMSGDFSDLSLSVLGLGGRVEGLDLKLKPEGLPPVTIKLQSVGVHLLWRELLAFRLVAEGRVDHSKTTVVIETSEEMKAATRMLVDFASRRQVGSQLEAQPAFRLARLELREAEILIADHTEPGVSRKSSEIWVHGAEGTLENFADRPALLAGRPTTLALKGEVQRSGAATLFLTADPLADQLDLAAELSLKHLDLRELYGFIAGETSLQVQGTVDAYVTLKVHDAQLEGAIKPVLENLHVSPAKANLVPEVEAMLANAGVGLAADRVPGRNSVSTVIPISGPVSAPHADVWSAVLVLLHSAYQVALPKDFSHEPPAPPGTKPAKGKVGQVSDALTRKRFPGVPAAPAGAVAGGTTGGKK